MKNMYHIVICEHATGIVLELDGKTRFKDLVKKSDYPCMTFSDLERAEKKASEIVNANHSLEVSIYTESKECIKTIFLE